MHIATSKTGKVAVGITLLCVLLFFYAFSHRNSSFSISFTEAVPSPDGTKIASAVTDTKRGETRVLISSYSGRVLKEKHIEGFSVDPSHPVTWSADSRLLFLARRPYFDGKSNRLEGAAICELEAENKEAPDLYMVVSKSGVTIESPTVSSDGVHLAYIQSTIDRNFIPTKTVWLRDLRTSQEVGLDTYRLLSLSKPEWSLDGTVVAFAGTQDPSLRDQPPYLDDDRNPSINVGIVWASPKDNFTPHFFKARASDFEINKDGSQFALITGRDKQGRQHLMRVVDTAGNEIAALKRTSIGGDVAWNSDNTAIFFLDNFYSNINLQLCRWDIKTGQVDVLDSLGGLRGIVLGYRNGTLFYSTAGLNEDNSCQIHQLKTD